MHLHPVHPVGTPESGSESVDNVYSDCIVLTVGCLSKSSLKEFDTKNDHRNDRERTSKTGLERNHRQGEALSP